MTMTIRPLDMDPHTACREIFGYMIDGDDVYLACHKSAVNLEELLDWLDIYPELNKRYERITEIMADAWLSIMIQTAKSLPAVIIDHKSGSSKIDMGDIAHKRLIIDTYKWAIAKKSERYGPKPEEFKLSGAQGNNNIQLSFLKTSND